MIHKFGKNWKWQAKCDSPRFKCPCARTTCWRRHRLDELTVKEGDKVNDPPLTSEGLPIDMKPRFENGTRNGTSDINDPNIPKVNGKPFKIYKPIEKGGDKNSDSDKGKGKRSPGSGGDSGGEKGKGKRSRSKTPGRRGGNAVPGEVFAYDRETYDRKKLALLSNAPKCCPNTQAGKECKPDGKFANWHSRTPEEYATKMTNHSNMVQALEACAPAS